MIVINTKMFCISHFFVKLDMVIHKIFNVRIMLQHIFLSKKKKHVVLCVILGHNLTFGVIQE